MIGVQVLVCLFLMQCQCDFVNGFNIVGFIFGYCGLLLGGFDQVLWKVCDYFKQYYILFQFGVNEDFVVILLWGIQQVNLFQGVKYDGVFGMWYGKGFGVDCCGDVFCYVNVVGILKFGGVLVIVGDDYGVCFFLLLYQIEYIFKVVMMLVLVLFGVQEYFDYGLYGWVMLCYFGCWVVFKVVVDIVESVVIVDFDINCVQLIIFDFELLEGGFNICWFDLLLVQEQCLLEYKLYVVLVYVWVNCFDCIVFDLFKVCIGIIIFGKFYLDVCQVLDIFGIDDELVQQIGLCLYKVGMVWLLEVEGVCQFVEGLEEIVVVEEKCYMIEYQFKEELYNW